VLASAVYFPLRAPRRSPSQSRSATGRTTGLHHARRFPGEDGPIASAGVSAKRCSQDLEAPRREKGDSLTPATALGVLGAVNPVGWARSQMAFTLGFHIILVPLGVSWAAITLVANYKAIKHDDKDALLLAQRWSKYMAVTFAVGAVTGTVLSFEFGLLWPTFIHRFGAAFGIPFTVEGLFFFLEAIFIAIYIYGWKRLKPWTHFWAGVPIMIAGIGGTVSVVAANAWMNQPAGFTLNSAGKIVRVDPFGVIFNKAMPLESLHMVVAAYLVGGFLVASIYAAAMFRGRNDRYHRLGFVIPFTVAAIATPVQLLVGDTLARWVAENQPVKFAAMELVPTTASHVPETILGHLNSDGTVTGGIKIPDLASLLTNPVKGASTVVQGLDTVPKGSQPTLAEVNIVHLGWDAMVGLGTALFLLAVWFALFWWRRHRLPATKWFLGCGAIAGVAAVICMEAGWVVTEVGRQPWIVYDYMKVQQATTTNGNIWIMFIVITVLYAALGVTTILVLRGMSRRWRADTRAGREDEDAGEDEGLPYGPGFSPPAAHPAKVTR
jgi:cytochrome bd ubiquinol oxidase subunit I